MKPQPITELRSGGNAVTECAQPAALRGRRLGVPDMERRGLRVIDGRANPRSRRDDRKIENATLTYEVEELGRKIVHLARNTRLELLRLDEGDGPSAA